MELRQLVSPILIYLDYVFTIFASFPANKKAPVVFFIAEDLWGIFKGGRLFVPNDVSPTVDLNCSSSLFSFWRNDEIDKFVFFKQADILRSKIITIHKNKLIELNERALTKHYETLCHI